MKIKNHSLPQQLLFFTFHLLFLITPFVFTWVNNELFEFNKMLTIYGFAAVILGLWSWKILSEKELRWKSHWLNWLAMAFLGGQILSSLFSIHFPSSWWGYPSRLNGGLLSSLVFVFLYFALVQNLNRKQVTRLIITNGFALALIALYAIPEHFGFSPSCLFIMKEWSVACWKQDVQNRVFASFGQPNWLATYLITLIPITTWLAQQTKQKNYQKLFWLITFLAILALTYTKSRSGMLGLVGGLSFALFLIGWEKLKTLFTKKWQSRLSLSFMGVILALAVWKYLVLPVSTADQYQPTSFDLSKGSSSANIRTIVWQGAWKNWLRRPLLGAGPATFAYTYYADRPISHNLVSEWDFLYNKAHNELLNYLAETGLIGFTTYLAFIGGTILLIKNDAFQNKPKQKTKADNLQKRLGLTFIAGLMALHISNFFGFSTAMSNLFLFSLPAFWLARKTPIKTKVINIKFTQLIEKSLKIGSFFLALFLISLLIKIWKADYFNARGKELFDLGEYAEALNMQQKAISLRPFQAEYYETLANSYAELGLIYYLQEEKELGLELTKAALENIDYALELNPQHLNFWKTKTRVLLLTSPLLEENLTLAEETIRLAITKAPTDAKLWYNLALALNEQEKIEAAIEVMEKTVTLKPNYIKARDQLGDLYQEANQPEKAKEQYRYILEKLSSIQTSVREKLKKLEETP